MFTIYLWQINNFLVVIIGIFDILRTTTTFTRKKTNRTKPVSYNFRLLRLKNSRRFSHNLYLYILHQKPWKFFNSIPKKSIFSSKFIFIKKSESKKKRSTDLKSALNFEFNYVPHYILLWHQCWVQSILRKWTWKKSKGGKNF